MSDGTPGDEKETPRGTDEGRPVSNRLLGEWRDIEADPPFMDGIDRWILVVNSAGFPAAVNCLTSTRKNSRGLQGWAVTAEGEQLLVSCIKWWQEITLP